MTMSDTFEFKNLSAAEAMDSPGDATTVLALDGGAVKQIPADKFGGGSFVVHLTPDESLGITAADKTYAEIMAAISSGAIPVAVLDLTALFGDDARLFAHICGAIGGDSIVFSAKSFDMSGEMLIACTPSDEWAVIQGE
jgi:hypothetical protein